MKTTSSVLKLADDASSLYLEEFQCTENTLRKSDVWSKQKRPGEYLIFRIRNQNFY